MERLRRRGPGQSRENMAYAAARAAGLANKMTAEEHLFGRIFGDAPSVEELRVRTPEDIKRIIEREEKEAEICHREIELRLLEDHQEFLRENFLAKKKALARPRNPQTQP